MTTPDAAVVTPGKGTVGFERKVQVRDYESAVASIFVQFDLGSTHNETENNIREAFFAAKSAVFEQLGIKFEYDAETGVLHEVLAKQFGTVTEVTSNEPPRQAQAAPASGGGPNCPKCNGAMYDNRASKTNPRQPDFRCKQYKGNPPCEGVIWPPKGGK